MSAESRVSGFARICVVWVYSLDSGQCGLGSADNAEKAERSEENNFDGRSSPDQIPVFSKRQFSRLTDIGAR